MHRKMLYRRMPEFNPRALAKLSSIPNGCTFPQMSVRDGTVQPGSDNADGRSKRPPASKKQQHVEQSLKTQGCSGVRAFAVAELYRGST